MLKQDWWSEGAAWRWPYLDLLNAVDNEHVLQVLHGSVHPVVEGRRPLGKLQVQLVNGLPQLLHTLQNTEGVNLHYRINVPLCHNVVVSPPVSPSSSGWGCPGCPTGHRCPGSGRWPWQRRGSRAHWSGRQSETPLIYKPDPSGQIQMLNWRKFTAGFQTKYLTF